MKNSLIRQLSEYGVKVIQQGGKNKVTLPWSPEQTPTEVIPLLRELKRQSTWDEPQALALFEATVDRLRRQYPSGAIPWAAKHRPELLETVHEAARQYREACLSQDLAKCRQAVAGYEQAVMTLFSAHKKSFASHN